MHSSMAIEGGAVRCCFVLIGAHLLVSRVALGWRRTLDYDEDATIANLREENIRLREENEAKERQIAECAWQDIVKIATERIA